MRKMIKENPYKDNEKANKREYPWVDSKNWPCKWITVPGEPSEPFIAAYRKLFKMEEDAVITVHVSGDEKYELYLDGERIGRGSEKGGRNCWYYETYELSICKGEHSLVAKVWSLGSFGPNSQLSIKHSFILSPEGEKYIRLLGTGVTAWEVKLLKGYYFEGNNISESVTFFTGSRVLIDGFYFDWGFELGLGDGWEKAMDLQEGNDGFDLYVFRQVHIMKPATLLPMKEKIIEGAQIRCILEVDEWDALKPMDCNKDLSWEHSIWEEALNGRQVTVPPFTQRKIVIDFNNYYCAYPQITLTGGRKSFVSISWAEALFKDREINIDQFLKSNRNEIDGLYFIGINDSIRSDGGDNRKYEFFWWRSGRYVEITVKTEAEALIINSLYFLETGYPVTIESEFECSDSSLNSFIPIAVQSLKACAHDTYMDCPYYEQLMYGGDTRVQILTWYTLSKDDTLIKKAIQVMESSRINYTGLLTACYPEKSGAVIPSFSLWWIGMLYDYGLWRGEKEYIRALLPSVRGILDIYLMHQMDTGLFRTPKGWNFIDWPDGNENGWWYGEPPLSEEGLSCVLNWNIALAFKMSAELEDFVGEDLLGERNRRILKKLVEDINECFWDEDNGLYTENRRKELYCEHSQCLAVLTGELDKERVDNIQKAISSSIPMAKTSIWYSHFLFEASKILSRTDIFYDRLKKWLELEQKGFKTTPETFKDSVRSDCHGWGAHPLHHYFTTILGIKPGSMGFETVEIVPNLGTLSWAKGKLMHPQGEIIVEFHVQEEKLRGYISLPEGICGRLRFKGSIVDLKPGVQEMLL